MQERYKIDGQDIWQPDADIEYALATTSTADSTRTQDGVMHDSPMFTVERCSYTATGIPVAEASKILKLIVGRHFTLHYFSVYNGRWQDGEFYFAETTPKIGTLIEGGEKLSELSFNMIGVKPIV